MESIYFVILNYNTEQDTINCINSIKRLETNSYRKKIVLIDNHSPDGSFNRLCARYSTDNDIVLYQMDDNVGFSRANNYGYSIVRKDSFAKYCVVCNSDVEFNQRDFIYRVDEEFKQSNFHILGPDVWCQSMKKKWYKGHQSPQYPFENNLNYIKAYYAYFNMLCQRLKGEKVSSVSIVVNNIWWTLWKIIRKIVTKTINREYRLHRQENVAIHGSCIIVSKIFMDLEQFLFYPEVKFYGEENLLYLRGKRKNYTMIYNPEIKIEHMQGRATASIDNSNNRLIFQFENYAIGAKTYLREERNYRKK